jgi:hypothetical protein
MATSAAKRTPAGPPEGNANTSSSADRKTGSEGDRQLETDDPSPKALLVPAYGSSQRGEEGDGGIGGDRTPAGSPKGTQTLAPPLTARRAAKATGRWRQETPPQKLCWFLACGSSQRGEEGDGGIGGDRTPAGPPKGTQTPAPPLTARRAAKATGRWRQETPPQKLCWFLAYGSSQRGEEGDGGIGGDRTPAGPPKGTQTLAPPLTARRAAKATGGAGPEPAVRRRSLQVARRSRNQLSRSSSVSDGVAASLPSTPTTEPLRLHEAPTVDLLAYPKCI